MVDPETLKIMRFEVDLRSVVLVCDRPGDARAAPRGKRILARRYTRLRLPFWVAATAGPFSTVFSGEGQRLDT